MMLFGRRELFVFGLTKGDNHFKNRFKQDETDGEAGAFTKGLSELNIHDDAEHEVGAWEKGEEAKHWLHVQDLEHGVGVVNWDERFPAFFASLGEDFPFSNDDKNRPSDDAEDKEEAEETGENPSARSRGDSCWIVI